ncbi:MAG: TonB-dependent receptor [Candidatus Omnitrophica bacterium]|nr:TonB-dependent receptor [Candidatus Omnitrophota bacterium]
MKKFCIFLLCIAIPTLAAAAAMDLDPIRVYSMKDILRNSDEPELLPSLSSGVDIQSRVNNGMLQDVSIRGGSFEDADVRIEGVRINNPQTGHFNLSVPIVPTDLKNTQVDLNGQYIDYSLKVPNKNEGIVRMSAGNGGYVDSITSASFGKGNTYNRVSYEGMRTDGLRPETDSKKNSASYTLFHEADLLTSQIYAAYLQKDFGEGGAYGAPWYMREEEHLKQQFVMGKFAFKENLDLILTPYFHQTDDTFFLDRYNRTANRNDHTTYVYGNDAKMYFMDRLFFTKLDIRQETLRSTNLNKHDRFIYEFGIGQEERQFGKFGYNFYCGALMLNNFPYQTIPKAGVFYDVFEQWRLSFDASRKYRTPSFTELYYFSPSSHGNADLAPQFSDNYEVGLTHKTEKFVARIDSFYRYEKDAIDWVRNNSDSFYRAVNVEKIQTSGYDLKVQYDLDWKFLKRFSTEFTGLYLTKNNNWDMSKYAFEYLRNRLVCKLEQSVGKWDFALAYIYEDHISQKSRSIVNGDIVYKISKNMDTFIKMENMFDNDYYEMRYIEAAPMSIRGGVEIKF